MLLSKVYAPRGAVLVAASVIVINYKSVGLISRATAFNYSTAVSTSEKERERERLSCFSTGSGHM